MATSTFKRKIIFIIADGIGDTSVHSLNNQTPLQASKIPKIDLLAKSGLTGLMDSVEPGYACGSDTSHMNIFGYSPFKHYRGRGAFETIGSGLSMDQGDVAFKCNFAHIDTKTKIVKLRRVDREFPEWGLPLIEPLNTLKVPGFPDHKVSALWATEHRIGLKINGPNLTDNITGTDPLKDNKKLWDCQPTDSEDPNAPKMCELINNLSEEITRVLEQQPINQNRAKEGLPTANLVTLRGAGSMLSLDKFDDVHG